MQKIEKNDIKPGDTLIYIGDNDLWFDKGEKCIVLEYRSTSFLVITFSKKEQDMGGFYFGDFAREIKGTIKEIAKLVGLPFTCKDSYGTYEVMYFDNEINKYVVYENSSKEIFDLTGTLEVIFIPTE